MHHPVFIYFLAFMIGLTPLAQSRASAPMEGLLELQEVSSGDYKGHKFPQDDQGKHFPQWMKFFEGNPDLYRVSLSKLIANLFVFSTPLMTVWLISKNDIPIGVAGVELLDCEHGFEEESCQKDYKQVKNQIGPLSQEWMIRYFVNHHLKITYYYSPSVLVAGARSSDLYFAVHNMLEGYYAHFMNHLIFPLNQVTQAIDTESFIEGVAGRQRGVFKKLEVKKNEVYQTHTPIGFFNRISAWLVLGERIFNFDTCTTLVPLGQSTLPPLELGRSPCHKNLAYLESGKASDSFHESYMTFAGMGLFLVAGGLICLMIPLNHLLLPIEEFDVGALEGGLMNKCYRLSTLVMRLLTNMIVLMGDFMKQADIRDVD